MKYAVRDRNLKNEYLSEVGGCCNSRRKPLLFDTLEEARVERDRKMHFTTEREVVEMSWVLLWYRENEKTDDYARKDIRLTGTDAKGAHKFSSAAEARQALDNSNGNGCLRFGYFGPTDKTGFKVLCRIRVVRS